MSPTFGAEPVLAAGSAPPFLVDVAILVLAGAGIAYVCYRLGLVPIVGFLVAGAIIGPNALGLIADQALVDAAAEVGVILLLFTIGIEFSLEKLAKIKTLIFGGGGLQVGLTTAAVTGILALLEVDWRVGVFTGFLVALSSTAIVLKLVGGWGVIDEETADTSVGLLIFQDLAIIVMVMLVPILGGDGGSGLEVAQALGLAGLLIAAVLVVARRVMPKILEVVARTCTQELFLLTVIAICFGTAYLTSLAGVSVSLGAFLAGLIVSESRFSAHAFSEVMPLQILFSATFFVSVGMLLDVMFLLENLLLVLGVVAAVLVLKIITTGISVAALGYGLPTAAAAGLTLAQMGEFSFVLERVGRDAGLSPAGVEAGAQVFIAATVLLMTMTPFLASAGSRLATWLRDRAQRKAAEAMMDDLPASMHGNGAHGGGLTDHVVVAGYGVAARRLVHVLAGSDVPFVITTLSPTGANEAEAEAEGFPVIRGDAAHPHILELAALHDARLLVIADDDPGRAHQITAVTRSYAPDLQIIVRTHDPEEADELYAAGADHVVTMELESIVQLFAEVLRRYDATAEEIEMYEATVRQGGYAALTEVRFGTDFEGAKRRGG